MRWPLLVALVAASASACEAITAGYGVRGAGDAGIEDDAAVGADVARDSPSEDAPDVVADVSSAQDGPSDATGQEGPSCVLTQTPVLASYSNTPESGIAFHALTNVVLTQFVFHNFGKTDSVSLTDSSCNAIDSVPVPANMQVVTLNVSWPLVAGRTYLLINQAAGNGAYAVASYPWDNGNLVVDSAVGCLGDAGAELFSQYWFNFSDLLTCP